MMVVITIPTKETLPSALRYMLELKRLKDLERLFAELDNCCAQNQPCALQTLCLQKFDRLMSSNQNIEIVEKGILKREYGSRLKK